MSPALIFQFTRQDLIDRYAGSVLGGLWTFIQPL
ncbi:MAG: ABC transporter permease, partial [Gammaproteobacteria bacterium]|nr:ABC transporter permease [Gammaproteobacteria bacterium]